MADDTGIRFYGLVHLIGETVQAHICGLDCGDYTVEADGSILVSFESDADGLLTPQYLYDRSDLSSTFYPHELSVTVRFVMSDDLVTMKIPAVIGQKYTSEGQGLRPLLPNDLSIRVNGLGKTRRSHEFAVLLHDTHEIQFGTGTSNLEEAIITGADGETAIPSSDLYSGVYRGVLTDEYGYDSMVYWRVDRPYPAVVCAVSSYLVSEG